QREHDMSRILAILPVCWCVCGVIWSASLSFGQEPAEAKLKQLAEESRKRAEGIEVKTTAGESTTKAAVHADPIMKYTDVPRQIEMATLWVWEEDGRPVALGKVEGYQRPGGTKWLYCFASASTGLVEGMWPDGRRFK